MPAPLANDSLPEIVLFSIVSPCGSAPPNGPRISMPPPSHPALLSNVDPEMKWPPVREAMPPPTEPRLFISARLCVIVEFVMVKRPLAYAPPPHEVPLIRYGFG